MPGRFALLTPPALLLVLAVPAAVQAHGLDAQAFSMPDGKVQIESWFTNGDVPHQAQVQVFRPDGGLLTEGRLDEKGTFVFSGPRAEALRVVVTAGPGHRKELEIPAEKPAPTAPPAAKIPLTDARPRETIKDVLVGLGFLLALAAFVLSLRNARHLRELRRETNHRDTEDTEKRKKREEREEG
jgi:nickel transport protein